MRNLLLLLCLFATTVAGAQKLKKEDRQILAQLQRHVVYLASDSLEGRRTGTKGEALASAYISNEFKNIGLQPKGTRGYLQPFEINEGKQINPPTHLLVDGQNLQLHREFFPLAFSPNATLEALASPAIEEVGTPWFFDLKELLEKNSNNPHFDLEAAVYEKAKEAKERGSTALFVYNSSEQKDGLQFNGKDRSEPAPIPVVYLTREAVRKYFNDESATLDLKLKVDMGPKTRTGTNVVGFIDNGAPSTVVVGAHFDHLGYGEDGNSLHREGKEVHNGADDNASGTAALMELARMLKASGPRKYNYLFIAFSGEELGLYGSKYFTEHPTVDLSTVAYMINLDMVGRLNGAMPVVTVGGFGTAPAWGELFNTSGKKGIYKGNLQFRFDSSGTGPSDHTSFYRKNIPVLFYFTGLHTDYHKPGDDADKINYHGQLQIVKHLYSLIENSAQKGPKLVFTPTREVQTSTTAMFKVTLGIMPDYTYSGKGVRVDGVSDNRPAQKAGIRAGDVIVQLGNTEVTSIEKYMQALSQFNKGDTTTVYFQRGNQRLSSPVEF